MSSVSPVPQLVRIEGPALVVVAGPGASSAVGREFTDRERATADSVEVALEAGRIVAVAIETADADRIRALQDAAEWHDRPADLVLLGAGRLRPPTIGFRAVTAVADAAGLRVERLPASWDHRERRGPFDVIGDVHGCFDELLSLLGRLGYRIAHDSAGRVVGASHPDGRIAVFVGDLVDRGPDVVGVLRLVMGMLRAGDALAVCGNHDDAIRRTLRGREVEVTGGIDVSLRSLARESAAFREEVAAMLDHLPAHLVLDDGRLVVAHAGLAERFQGRESARVRALCLFGPTTGGLDEHGLPVRLDWARDYRGAATVVYGHSPIAVPVWQHGTIGIDTGCAFGGALTALRYPEQRLVAVPAARAYSAPARPFLPAP